MPPTADYSQPLKQLFGFEDFRQGQRQVIDKLLSQQSALAIFPTGSGKSLCYQFAATQLPNLTLVVSPLLALMKNQLDFLHARQIPAASIDSTLTQQQYNDVVSGLRNNHIKILMVSVERFNNERFRALLDTLTISLLVVDEAHCISEWGHNFRPDYLKLPAYKTTFNIPQTLLLTATATQKVKQDMARRFDIAPDNIIQTGFYRANLDLSVVPVDEHNKPQRLLEFVQSRPQHSGIVYVTLQKSAQQVAEFLTAQGVNATAYHAGLKDEVRQQIQHDFMAGNSKVIVATIAFGMGIDKADIRYVVHHDLPKSIENYSQEIGRAGRDGQPAECVVLANLDALNTLENFVYGDTPEHSGIRAVLDDIKQRQQRSGADALWEYQNYGLSMLSNIRQLTLKTLLVQLELRGVVKPRYAYVAEYQIKLLAEQQAILARFNGERHAFVSAIFDHTQFKRTWGVVNIDALVAAYPTDRKRVVVALDYLKSEQLIDMKSSGITEVCEVDANALAKPDLADELHSGFKQHEAAEIARIQHLIDFMQSRQCLSFGLARYFDDANSPQRCGHCSVCRGQVARLHRSADETPIPLAQLTAKTAHFIDVLRGHDLQNPSVDFVTRFLLGLSVPLFTRLKARTIDGYAMFEEHRYGDVRQAVCQAFPDLVR